MSSTAKKSDDNLFELINLFKTFPLLEGFPENLVIEIARVSEILYFPPGCEILTQGQQNAHLYFLIDGDIGILVDGCQVSKMERRGELLGEMSVVSNKTVAATLRAETPVTVIRVDSQVFAQLGDAQRDLSHSLLYRIYATVLTDKLTATNQKAKHFEEVTLHLTEVKCKLEEANRILEKKVAERTLKLGQQNAELIADGQKMNELLINRRVLIQKLGEFQNSHLSPLKAFLDNTRKKNPEVMTVNEARRVVFNVQQLLGPLTVQESADQAMRSKRVLLADSHKKGQIVAKMALGGSGVVLDLASSLKDGQEKINNNTYDLIFLNDEMLELGNLAVRKNPGVGLVLMTSAAIPTYLEPLKRLTVVPHIVSRDEDDRIFTVKNIMTTATKLLIQDLFGLEKYLTAGVDIQSRMMVSSKKRGDLLTEIETYFEKLGIRRSSLDRVRTVLEEMLMNAVFDAPVSAEGSPLYNHLPRTAEVVLKPDEQAVVRFATDGMLMAVSVQDPFGSLDGSTILNYLEHNYTGCADQIHANKAKAGAGRGLHQIVENSDLVVFNLDSNKRTEVIALFNLDTSKTAHKNPSFHLFTKS